MNPSTVSRDGEEIHYKKHGPDVTWNGNKKKLFPRKKHRCITGRHNCWVLSKADLSQD